MMEIVAAGLNAFPVAAFMAYEGPMTWCLRSRRLSGAIVAAMVLLLAGCSRGPSDRLGPAGDQEVVVGVSLLNLSSEFIVMLNRAMEAKAREMGVRLIVTDAQRNAERQVQQVERFVAQSVNAIILNPCEVEASSPAVDRARQAGIPIVNVNSETRSVPDAFIGSRDEESARLAMGHIATRLGGRGNVVMMHGYLGQAAQLKREQGAREILAQHPELRLIAEQTAEWDRAKAMSLMENWIQSMGSRIQAVFAHNDEMAMGALLALEQAGLKDRVVVVGVDAIADALQAVAEGRLDATVFQDAVRQGSTAVETAVRLARRETADPEVFIPFRLVTRSNISDYLNRPADQ
jgi:inositol transport system substrate-binding protein